ncbi:MAG TPA: glycosyltransferase family 4 protein [Vicinamibacterales bacterium]
MNRRLAHEMAIAGGSGWSVTAVAPASYRGDLGRIDLAPDPEEKNELRAIRARVQRVPHLMRYADLDAALAGGWDVVHCWEEPYVAAGAQIARAVPRDAAFVVATFQNLKKRYPWPLSRFERATMARADGWIAFGRSILTALGSRPSYARLPSRVIPPGVDVLRFAPNPTASARVRADLGWPADAIVVGYLGRFVREKGIQVLWESLERIPDGWHALFVGGGPLEPELRTFESRHPSRVKVVTGVSHDRVPEWLNAMSLVCLPSLTTAHWREQFGRVLIEAMACGIPVVASDSGEMPHVVGDAGVIAAEGEGGSWASAIERLIGSDEERRRLSAAGLDRARSVFAWPVVARAHLEFFGELLGGA